MTLVQKLAATAVPWEISTQTADLQDGDRFALPLWRQILWGILYGVMVIVGTGGNLIVIWIVCSHKQMRTVTNYFLLNLALADAMATSLNVTFNFIYVLFSSHWPFGEIYCKITQFVAVLSVYASVFSLMSISIDRYMAIMTPLKPRMGHTMTILVAMGIWVISIIMGTPNLFFYKTALDDYGRIVCYPQWPDGELNSSDMEYIYNILFLVFAYMAPIIIMMYTYSRIGMELWGSQSIGECTQRQMENIKSKKKVVKMMIVVVVIFTVCWLPYHLYFLLTSSFPELMESPYIQEIFLAIYWLAMSNSMYNPIIYCWMNARFRNGFKQFFSLPFAASIPRTFSRHTASSKRCSIWETQNTSL